MESLIVKIIETSIIGGLFLFGMKEFFGYLKNRNNRADQREADMIDLQRENQKIQSNHMVHSTQAINDLTQVVGKSTKASEALVDIAESCALVQNQKKNRAK